MGGIGVLGRVRSRLVVDRLDDGVGLPVGVLVTVVVLRGLVDRWAIVERCMGLTYGLGAWAGLAAVRALVARLSSVSKLGLPEVISFGEGKPRGVVSKLSDLKAARPKTSSRMCEASSAGRCRVPQYSR
jgi:hypothetical protein